MNKYETRARGVAQSLLFLASALALKVESLAAFKLKERLAFTANCTILFAEQIPPLV